MALSTPPADLVERIHRETTVVDGHSDVPLDVVKRRRAGERRVLVRLHLPAWREGGVAGAILTLAGDESQANSLSAFAAESLAYLQAEVAEEPQALAIAAAPAEFQSAARAGRFAIALNLEGAGTLEGRLDNLERFWRAGVRFMTLTWNHRNQVGAGAACSPADGGLTDFGRQVVRQMARLGMVADLSHASPATFWDAVRLETGNLVATHSNAAALRPHARNLTDDQIRALVEQGGYVGVCFYPAFLPSARPTVDNVVDQIAYLGDLVGLDHVTLGPDYIDYVLADMIEHLKTSGIQYGENFVYPEGVETISRLKNLTRAMLRRGLAPGEIGQVLGGNLLRIWTRIAAAGGTT